MLLALFALAAGAAAGWLAGRRPGPAGRHWKAPATVPVGVVAMIAGGRWNGALGWGAMAVGYGCLVAFAVANSRRPGLALVAVGLLANLVVIGADGGMPVRSQPPGVQIGAHHHGLSSNDRLPGLADTILISPLHETVSPGDLIVVAGGAVAAFFWLEPGGGRRRRAGQSRAGHSRRDGLVRPS